MLFGGGLAPFRPPEHHAFCLLPCQSFFGALADQVALDLSREAKGEGKHLARDVVPQAVIVFDRPHLALLVHADIEYVHDHKQAAPEAGELAADDHVALRNLLQEHA